MVIPGGGCEVSLVRTVGGVPDRGFLTAGDMSLRGRVVVDGVLILSRVEES